MKKKWETRYFVTAVASIPVYKAYSKTETYRQAAKDGWGTVYRDENNTLVCNEDCSADFYTKDGRYFGISANDEVNTKEMPKQAACAAIIISDSCGFTFWAEDFNQIHIFVTYDENGLVDTYRVECDPDAKPYDGETEISFEDLYKHEGEEWDHSYRAEIPGTAEYQSKQEADALAQEAGETWMDAEQREQFREICGMIDTIKSGRNFYRVMNQINGGRYSVDVINAAREFKQCFNSAQYEPEAAADAAEDNQQEAGTVAEAASEGRETALGTPETMAGTNATAAAEEPQDAPKGEAEGRKLWALTMEEAKRRKLWAYSRAQKQRKRKPP